MKPRSTAVTLRVIAIGQMAAFAITFFPGAWIASFHTWLGLGQMPDSAFLRYIIRGAAWSQGAFGVLFWVMALDVVRYRRIVITVAALYLIASPTFYLVDSTVGLPLAWCLWDCLCCLFAGSILLLFCLWPSPNKSLQPTPGGAPVSNLHLSPGVTEP
jgi:hypothetical protein